MYQNKRKQKIMAATYPAFNDLWLKHFERRPTRPVDQDVGFIMMTIDPALGSDYRWGICACYYTLKDKFHQVIIHLDNPVLELGTYESFGVLLKETIDTIRKSFEKTPILLACMASPRIVALQVNDCVTQMLADGRIKNVTMMKEVNGEFPGITMTQATLELGVTVTASLLSTDSIWFSKVCTGTEKAKAEYFQQLKNFCFTERTLGIYKVLPTASCDHNDELGVPAILNAFWMLHVLHSDKPEYAHIKPNSETVQRATKMIFKY